MRGTRIRKKKFAPRIGIRLFLIGGQLFFSFFPFFFAPRLWEKSAVFVTLMDSVMVPIWLTLSNKELQAFFSTAVAMRRGLVTVKSSPTIWMSVEPVKWDQADQSSWSKGSSIETMG